MRPRAFKLDHLRAGLQQPCGGVERTLRRGVGLERAGVSDEQCASEMTRNRSGVIRDVVDRDRQRRPGL